MVLGGSDLALQVPMRHLPWFRFAMEVSLLFVLLEELTRTFQADIDVAILLCQLSFCCMNTVIFIEIRHILPPPKVLWFLI